MRARELLHSARPGSEHRGGRPGGWGRGVRLAEVEVVCVTRKGIWGMGGTQAERTFEGLVWLSGVGHVVSKMENGSGSGVAHSSFRRLPC